MAGALDSSLKFALTALWNLTDETPGAARSFLECRGLELYLEVLEVREQADKRQPVRIFSPHGDAFICFYSRSTANLRFSRRFWASWWVLSGSMSAQFKGILGSENTPAVVSRVIAEQCSGGSGLTARPAGRGPPGAHPESAAGRPGGHGGPLLCRGDSSSAGLQTTSLDPE